MTMSRKEMKKQKNREEMRAANAEGGIKTMYLVAAFVLLFGAGIAQFAAMACGLFGGDKLGGSSFSMGPSGPVEFMDVNNEEHVKHYLFSGNPVIVFCQNDKSEGTPVPKIVSDVSGELASNKQTADVRVVNANCFKPLMNSGDNKKTIANHYNFGKKDNFIAIFSGNNKPVQLNYLPSVKYVTKTLKPLLKTGVNRVVYLKDFESCQGNKNCVILTSKKKEVLGRMEARMKPLMKSHRSLSVVSVDSDFYKVTVDSEFAKQKPTQTEEESSQYGEAICVAKNTHNDEFEEFKNPKQFKINKAKNSEKVLKSMFLKSWSSDEEINNFLQQCENGGEESWFKLSKEVTVKARSSGEAKVIKATRPKGAKGVEDGTKKGKERVGRRPDVKHEDDEENEEDDEEENEDEEEEVEEEELAEDVEL